MNKRQIRQAMYEADRARARIAYAGLRDGMTEAQEQRLLDRNRATPEYVEANARFLELSAALDDKRGPKLY